MALDIESKVDSPEKLAAIEGKPTQHYLFAEEVNQIVNAVDTLEENVESLATNKQDNLNATNLGALSNGLATEDDIQDSDKLNFTDTSDSNKQKKTTWLNIKAKIVAVIDNLFVAKIRTLTIGGVTQDLSANRTFEQQYFNIVSNTTLSSIHNNSILRIKSNATITIPTGLPSDFNFVVAIYAGVTYNQVAGSGVTQSPSSISVTGENMITTFIDGTNNYKSFGV